MSSFLKKYKEFLFESAPRLPKSEEYWIKQGKSGKNVCLIIHDDLDGICSGIIMKNYLKQNGFKIKQIGVINYQKGWTAFHIDSKLITIALDFAESIPGAIYIDHHGKFEDEVAHSQKQPAIKTPTGSAAEGIADELGVPFSQDTKYWIDMIDSAKYSEYDIDIKGILDFDLKSIVKSPKAKLKFAAAMNQLISRSDHKTIVEVVNSCDQPSIFNIYRLFKIFYPKNNPDWRSGEEPEFVKSGRERISMMQKKTRGTQGYNEDGTKKIYTNQKDFWKDFAQKVSDEIDEKTGEPIEKWKLNPGNYQIIGNLMFVPSGTWSNALRAKAIYQQDIENGILPDDPKRNFVLLQYGNTLQIADLNTKIKKMNKEDLPIDRKGNVINHLGHYCENLVKNFEEYLGYQDTRTVAGGHDGIGSISNIFGKCNMSSYEGSRFLEMFKNKIIEDLSGIKWNTAMPWNEEDAKPFRVREEEINKKLMDITDVRTEEDVRLERKELEIMNYLVINKIQDRNLLKRFRSDFVNKLYSIYLDTEFSEVQSGEINLKDLSALYFKKKKLIEETDLFNEIVKTFNLSEIYNEMLDETRKEQRKKLKQVFWYIIKMYDRYFYTDNTEGTSEKWLGR